MFLLLNQYLYGFKNALQKYYLDLITLDIISSISCKLGSEYQGSNGSGLVTICYGRNACAKGKILILIFPVCSRRNKLAVEFIH